MLSEEEKQRYARQILIPEIGEEGQQRLKDAAVLVAGLGGLGSAAACYLAAAGVGTLRIADRDTVSLPDLNRQILYTEADIGRVKTDAAQQRLSALNGSCSIEAKTTDICGAPVELVKGCDLVIDATDNLTARRALNRAAVRSGTPMIHGGIEGFSGTVAAILPGKTACLECLFPARGRDPASCPIPALGPVVGMVASIQTAEAVKLLLSAGRSLTGKMLMIRADTAEFKFIETRRNPDCALCASI